jgi:hypothetical protein
MLYAAPEGPLFHGDAHTSSFSATSGSRALPSWNWNCGAPIPLLLRLVPGACAGPPAIHVVAIVFVVGAKFAAQSWHFIEHHEQMDAEGGCPHVSRGNSQDGNLGEIYLLPRYSLSPTECGIVQMVVETGAALAGRVFIWATNPRGRRCTRQKSRFLTSKERWFGMTRILGTRTLENEVQRLFRETESGEE